MLSLGQVPRDRDGRGWGHALPPHNPPVLSLTDLKELLKHHPDAGDLGCFLCCLFGLEFIAEVVCKRASFCYS